MDGTTVSLDYTGITVFTVMVNFAHSIVHTYGGLYLGFKVFRIFPGFWEGRCLISEAPLFNIFGNICEIKTVVALVIYIG